jgi:NAD(P) transhydrogenase subunit beta
MTSFQAVIQLVYVIAAACFVIGLHLMNSPATARRGNQVSTVGMVIAIAATLVLLIHYGTVKPIGWIALGAGTLIGAGIGLYSARTIKMTAMPQLVSMFNAVGGGAATLVGVYDYLHTENLPGGVLGTTTVATLLDVIIGCVTFSGSLIAAGKLQGVIGGQPIVFRGSRLVNIVLGVVLLSRRYSCSPPPASSPCW